MLKKAKLLTGEIIDYTVWASREDAFVKEVYPRYQYAGRGYSISEDGLDREVVYHFWVSSKVYSVFDLQKGDKVLVNLFEDGVNKLTWVIMSGLIGNTGAASMLRIDGTNINYPFRNIDILYVEDGNTGMPIIKSAMAKEALLKGGYHLMSYINSFNEMPLKAGDYITAGEGYEKENNSLNIRNNHKVLNQGDLIFESWTKGSKYAIVKSIGLNKSTFLAINSIYVKMVI